MEIKINWKQKKSNDAAVTYILSMYFIVVKVFLSIIQHFQLIWYFPTTIASHMHWYMCLFLSMLSDQQWSAGNLSRIEAGVLTYEQTYWLRSFLFFLFFSFY